MVLPPFSFFSAYFKQQIISIYLSMFLYQVLSQYDELVELDLSANRLLSVEPALRNLPLLHLYLPANRALAQLCSQVFHSLPNLRKLGELYYLKNLAI